MSDQFANWTMEEPCPCSEPNYFTKSLIWEEVQMVNGQTEVLYTVGRVASYFFMDRVIYNTLFMKDVTHEAVQATIKCESCGREFHKTYDLTMEGKRNRWGYYGLRRKEKHRSTQRFSFEHVEEWFAQMSENYHLIQRNCGHWAREFYAKVAEPDMHQLWEMLIHGYQW